MKKTIVFLLIVLSSNTFATTYTFTGSGRWSISSNWFGNSIPPLNITTGDNIVIDGSGICFMDVNVTINVGVFLDIKSNRTLAVNQSFALVNNGIVTCSGSLLNSGTITDINTIWIEDGGAVQNQASGYIELLAIGEIFFNGNGTFLNDGIINFQASPVGIFLGAVILQNNGTLSGDGTIQGITSNNITGNVNPGNGSGNLYFTSLITAGNINIQLGGITQNIEHDIISALDNVNINGGTLNVSLINGFLPQGGQTFIIILNGTHNGSFSQVNFPAIPGVSWAVQYLVDKTVIQTLTTLPVRYLSFTGRLTGNEIKLNWQIASAQNNVGFNIERSVDGATWSTVGFKTVSNDGTYSFVDSLPFVGVNYYRLKQFDVNGTSAYSSIVHVRMIKDKWEIYPNPAQNTLWVKGLNSNNAIVCIYSLAGILIKEVKLVSGRIDISDLPSSILLLKISEQGKILTFPFIKN